MLKDYAIQAIRKWLQFINLSSIWKPIDYKKIELWIGTFFKTKKSATWGAFFVAKKQVLNFNKETCWESVNVWSIGVVKKWQESRLGKECEATVSHTHHFIGRPTKALKWARKPILWFSQAIFSICAAAWSIGVPYPPDQLHLPISFEVF